MPLPNDATDKAKMAEGGIFSSSDNDVATEGLVIKRTMAFEKMLFASQRILKCK
jgi:hypothetical protein